MGDQLGQFRQLGGIGGIGGIGQFIGSVGSMKSLDLETASHLADVGASEASETLIASAVDHEELLERDLTPTDASYDAIDAQFKLADLPVDPPSSLPLPGQKQEQPEVEEEEEEKEE